MTVDDLLYMMIAAMSLGASTGLFIVTLLYFFE